MEKKNKNIIEVIGINKVFGERKVLKDINLHVKENETVSVLGFSGSGKTTLFHIIAGMLSADSGSILTDAKLGYMMQKDLLMPWKTVMENIMLPLTLKGTKKKDGMETVKKLMPDFGLSGTENLYPNALSGGMRQRAALLRTYLQSGHVLLLDEPFSSVDAITRHQLHTWIKQIKKQLKISILLITHDVEEALTLSDRIYVLGNIPAEIIEIIEVTDKTKKDKARDRIYEILEG